MKAYRSTATSVARLMLRTMVKVLAERARSYTLKKKALANQTMASVMNHLKLANNADAVTGKSLQIPTAAIRAMDRMPKSTVANSILRSDRRRFKLGRAKRRRQLLGFSGFGGVADDRSLCSISDSSIVMGPSIFVSLWVMSIGGSESSGADLGNDLGVSNFSWKLDTGVF